MSKIAIIGATGRVGSHLLEEAQRRGHSVTAIARNTAEIGEQEGVVAKQLNVLDCEALTAAVNGHDVVISAARFATVSADQVIAPVKAAGVKRLLVVGGAASLLLPDNTRVIDSSNFPKEYLAEASAGVLFLDVLRKEQDLDWTFLSPPAEFVEGKRTGQFRIGTDYLLFDAAGRSWISFADYAIAMIDEVEMPQFLRKRFTVGY